MITELDKTDLKRKGRQEIHNGSKSEYTLMQKLLGQSNVGYKYNISRLNEFFYVNLLSFICIEIYSCDP
jgi:hypothetical protein